MVFEQPPWVSREWLMPNYSRNITPIINTQSFTLPLPPLASVYLGLFCMRLRKYSVTHWWTSLNDLFFEVEIMEFNSPNLHIVSNNRYLHLHCVSIIVIPPVIRTVWILSNSQYLLKSLQLPANIILN